MADWLKGLGILGGRSHKSGSDQLVTEAAKAVFTTIQKAKQLKRMEEAARQESARQNAVLSAPPPVHGSARWATPRDTQQAGLLYGGDQYEHGSSILLGALPAGIEPGAPPVGWLYWDGEGHLLTVAPTRSGKATTQIIPNLLRYRGSVVVLDPKGELFDTTSAWRAANVGPVYRIAPFDNNSALPRHGFNPLSAIDVPADARALAELMIPEDKNASDFFKNDAMNFLSAAIQYVKGEAPPDLRTFNEVRRLLSEPIGSFAAIVQDMQRSPIEAVRRAANAVEAKNRERGLPVLKDTLNAALGIWDDPGVIEATSRSDIDFKGLKDRPATVYIQIPFDKMRAFGPFLKVILTSALEGMLQNPRTPEIPVLFVLDEFLTLGTFPKFLEAINTHASAGVRLWFFLQNLAKLEELYPTSWKNFFDASVKTFFGIRETFTGRLVSEFLGDATIAYRSTSLSLNLSSSTSGLGTDHTGGTGVTLNSSVQLSGRALLTPAEVVQTLEPQLPDKSRHGILLVPNTPPVMARLVPYFSGNRSLSRIGCMRPIL